jgi:hypothetical protein
MASHDDRVISTTMAEVETLARRLLAQIRARARAGLTRPFEEAARRLREGAASAAAMIEAYARRLRLALAPPPVRRIKRRVHRRRTGALRTHAVRA